MENFSFHTFLRALVLVTRWRKFELHSYLRSQVIRLTITRLLL